MGTVGHDADDGASFWIVGEILLLIEGLWIAGISSSGTSSLERPRLPHKSDTGDPNLGHHGVVRRQASVWTDIAVVAGLALLSVATWKFLRSTDPEPGPGRFQEWGDSPYYGATWLLLPLLVLVIGLLLPGAGRAMACSLALIVPLMVATYVEGGVLWDHQDGANFWPLAEVMLAVQGVVIFAGGLIGTALGNWRGRVRGGAVPPPWPLARRS